MFWGLDLGLGCMVYLALLRDKHPEWQEVCLVLLLMPKAHVNGALGRGSEQRL